jgi:glycosyltransferase involved in cell wall biosynthesis
LGDASAVTHLSVAMAEVAYQFADVRAKSRIITNGLDLTAWDAPSPSPAEGYVLAIGRLDVRKGFDTLLDAVALLKKRGSAPSLVIAGTGPNSESLTRRAGELGLSVCSRLEDLPSGGGAVCFPGYVSGAPKQKLFAGCSVVAFPSRWEAFGLVLLEAMVMGRAVIASDLPTVRQIVTDGRNGLIVPAENAAAWADAIQKLLSDTTLRRQMEQANRQDVARYNWRTIAGQYAELYRRVLAESNASKANAGR